jgi:hypothetical protein
MDQPIARTSPSSSSSRTLREFEQVRPAILGALLDDAVGLRLLRGAAARVVGIGPYPTEIVMG